MIRRTLSMLLLSLAVATPAAAEEDWTSGKTLAVGGAGRAMPLDTSGIVLNPGAIISPLPAYASEVGYQRFDATRSDVLHTSVLDCKTSLLAMGVSQTFEWQRPPFFPSEDLSWFDSEGVDELEDKRRIDRFVWAMAYGFAQRRFNLGASLRVYHVRDPLRGDTSPVSLDVGLSWWVSPNVAIGVVGGNLVPTKLEEEPTTLAGGFGVMTLGGILWFEADGVLDFDSADKVQVDVRAGAQLTLLTQFNIRAGYASDSMFGQQYVSWGLGWTVPQFSAGYTMRVELGDMERRLNPDKNEAANRMLHSWMITVMF